MKKFSIFGRDIIIGKRLFGLGKDDNYFGMFSGSSSGADRELLTTYQGFVYACINRIAQSVASSYEPKIYKKNGDQWVALTEHPMYDLLRNPNGRGDKAVNVSQYDLMYATASFAELQGETYWYMGKGKITGQPREITIIPANKVGKDLDDQGDIIRFWIRTLAGTKIYIDVEDMVPMIGFDPLDAYGGKGPTEAALDLIKTDDFTTKFVKNFFKNNAGINGVMSLKGDVADTAFDKFVRGWRSKYEGVDNAGKLAIVRGTDAEFTKVGMGLNELDMSALRNMTKEDVAEVYGVPLALLGKIEQSGLGRSNVEAFEYIFAKYTIEPKLKKLDSTLQFMLERYYDGEGLRVGHEDIIPDDEAAELAERVAAVDVWMTRNEIRREEGLDPIDGGDQLFVALNNIPVNEGSMTATDSGKSAKGIVIKRVVTTESKKKDQTETKNTTYTVEQKETFRLRVMRNQAQYERKYKMVVRPIFKEQRKEALNNLEAHSASLTKDFDQKLFDDAYYDDKLVKSLQPTLVQLGKDQGALALVFAGDTENEFRMTATYEKYIADSTRKMAKNFNDETLAALNRTLAQGIQNGEALAKLKQRVNAVYDDVDGYRSLRIARTETLKASNTATNEAYKQTGYVKAKEWVVNPGACEQCEEFAGKQKELNETFLPQGDSYTVGSGDDARTIVNDYADIDNPPLHPNCRCTIIPIR